jgi:hypothetical protein
MAAYVAVGCAASSGGAHPLQLDSPIANPLDSTLPTPVPLESPVAIDPFAPTPAPAECTAETPCPEGTSTPEFKTFLPGVGEQPGSAEQPPSTPPDLGALLNYAAVAIVVIGVTLKVYWFVTDRRKAK